MSKLARPEVVLDVLGDSLKAVQEEGRADIHAMQLLALTSILQVMIQIRDEARDGRINPKFIGGGPG